MSAPGEGTADEVAVQIAFIAGAELLVLDSDLIAYDFVQEAGSTNLKYPRCFCMPPTYKLDDRSMGAGSQRLLQVTLRFIILVGLSSNQLRPLIKETDRYVLPALSMFMRHRSLNGTVRNLELDETVMGELLLNNVKHFGLEIPVSYKQRVTIPSRL